MLDYCRSLLPTQTSCCFTISTHKLSMCALHVYTNSPCVLFVHTQTLHMYSPCMHKLSMCTLQEYTNSPCIHKLSCCFIINIYLPAQTVWCFDISVHYTDADFVVVLPPAFVSPVNFPLPCSTTTRSPCPGARP